MIYVNMRGNLGNQLFTYAFARKIQEVTNQKICINYYYLKKYKTEYVFNLDKYVLNENVIYECEKKLHFWGNPYTMFSRVMKRFFPELYFKIMSFFGIYMWLGKEYKQISIRKHKNYYIDGFYQCAKYFDDIRDIIIDEFIPKVQREKSNQALYKLIEETNSICVTIRRGDYVSNPKYKERFFVCDEQYFYRASNEIKELVENPTFFVFSDDIEWAKDNIKFGENTYYESGNDSVEEKLRLMSSCKHFIISNSSFSWWAQYLSDTKEKIVVAPENWYADGTQTDIYQKEWILQKVNKEN